MLTHPLGEISLQCLDDQMVVVAHQTIGVTRPAKALHHITENFHIRMPVLIVFVDRLLPVTARCHMLERACKRDPQRPSHHGSAIELDLTPGPV